MNAPDMPGEVWADYLEEQGLSVEEFRAWLSWGVFMHQYTDDGNNNFGDGSTGDSGDSYLLEDLGNGPNPPGWHDYGDGPNTREDRGNPNYAN